MKKIIIVNNNMEIGGVQKSLHNLLWAIHDRYDVTLCLFRAGGVYMEQLPPDVKVITCQGPFRYLGINQARCVGIHKLLRGALALTAHCFGRNAAMKLMLAGEKTLPQTYDCAIAYLHNGKIGNFYGGVQEYVLHKIRARKKVAFLHGDYGNCGANHPVNNRLIGKFDRIAACSDGCRRVFEKLLPELAHKCVTVRNCHRVDQIRQLADTDPVEYEPGCRNVVMVSRLSREKGIERAVAAVAHSVEQGIPVMLHIVGGGPMRPMLAETAEKKQIGKWVRFYGEQTNPYRYMKNADLFLMTSYHEAAPMVIEEATCLGVPVLSTRTTSSEDMIVKRGCGWVCENSQEALDSALLDTLRDHARLGALKAKLQSRPVNNGEATAQFVSLIEG